MRCNIPTAQGSASLIHTDSGDNLMMHAAMAAAPDGVVLVDRDGIILMANASMAAMSGYSIEQLRGQSVSIFLPPALRGKHGQAMHSYFLRPSKRTMGPVLDF